MKKHKLDCVWALEKYCYNVQTKKKRQTYHKVFGIWQNFLKIVDKQLILVKRRLSLNYTLDFKISTKPEMKNIQRNQTAYV